VVQYQGSHGIQVLANSGFRQIQVFAIQVFAFPSAVGVLVVVSSVVHVAPVAAAAALFSHGACGLG
jgi:hypothetical protein